MLLVEVLEYFVLHLRELLLHPVEYHLLRLSDGLSHKSIPICHTLQDLPLSHF